MEWTHLPIEQLQALANMVMNPWPMVTIIYTQIWSTVQPVCSLERHVDLRHVVHEYNENLTFMGP